MLSLNSNQGGEGVKNDLIGLIDSKTNIENLFHTIGGGSIPEMDIIYDIQEFQDWLMELKFELQDIYDRCHDQYIWETLRVCEKRMNGFNDKPIFSEISGRLRAIRKNIDKYYPNEKSAIVKEVVSNMNNEKKPLIFISHSSENKAQVKLLVEMMRSINMQPKDIFCSSLPGYDIPIDTEDRIFDFLRTRFLEYDIHVIFIHSKDYYSSAVSLNEMGAAWALKSKATSFLLPGFDFTDMKGVINGDKIAIKVDHEITEVKDKLNQFRNMLVKEFRLESIPDITWEEARDKFIKEINCSKEIEQQPEKTIEMNLLMKVAATDEGIILTSYDTERGMLILIGDEVVASEYPNRREYAKWDEALKECIKKGFIEQRNQDVYVITNSGYKKVEG